MVRDANGQKLGHFYFEEGEEQGRDGLRPTWRSCRSCCEARTRADEREPQYAQFEYEFAYKGQTQHRDHLARCTCLLGSSKPRHTLRPLPNPTLAGHGWYRPVSLIGGVVLIDED